MLICLVSFLKETGRLVSFKAQGLYARGKQDKTYRQRKATGVKCLHASLLPV